MRISNLGIALLLAAATGLLFAVSLTTLRIDRYGPTPVDLELPQLLRHWLPYAASWAALGVVAWQLVRRPNDAGGLRPDLIIPAIVLVAAVLRLVVLVGTTPTLSDDIWRYIHDGKTMAAGENPYARSPEEVIDALEVGGTAPGPTMTHEIVLDRVNNPELVTIYQPTSQWVFAALATLHNGLGELGRRVDPLGDRTFRLGFIGIDLLIVAMIAALLRAVGVSPWWAVLYGWHPLAVSEIAAAGHQDVIGIALLLMALFVVDDALERPGAAVFCGAALALSLAVKPVVLPVAVIMLWNLRRAPTPLAIVAGSAASALLLAYAPFALMEGGLSRMLETGARFTAKWSFNGSLYGLADWAGLHRGVFSVLAAGALGAIVLTLLARRVDYLRAAGVIFLASLLLSPTAHPWYLLWALVFVPLWFDRTTWVFSLTIVLSYAALLHVESYKPPAWLVAVEYAPVYAVAAWEAWRWWRRPPGEPPLPEATP